MRTSLTYQHNLIKVEVIPEHTTKVYAVVEVQIHSFMAWH